MAQVRQPSGARHEVAPGELFFSMTDRRGVITAANSVFVRMSRFARDELMGAPHSIIRHPAMPAGAFKLMWDELLADRPFCAYVNNLASDGSTYTVFATITPAADGFLSVRTRPLRTDLLEPALSLYGVVRPLEVAASEQGRNRRDTATLGLERLAALLAQTPFGDYAEFQWQALMAEAEARAAQAAAAPRPVGRSLADMLDCCQTLAGELRSWSDHYAALIRLVHLLADAITDLLGAAGTLSRTALTLGAAEDTAARTPLVTRLNAMTALIDHLVGQLRGFRQSCRDASTWAALAELQTEALSQFVKELGVDRPAASDRAAVHQLCEALVRDFIQVSELAERTAAKAEALVPQLGHTQALIFGQPTTFDASQPASGAVDELAQVEQSLGVIARLGHEIRAVSTPQDTLAAEHQVIRLLTLMALLNR